MAYLFPHSTFIAALQTPVVDLNPTTDFNNIPILKDLTKNLRTKKEDVSRLGTRDLLRRDYKEYTFIPSWAKDSQIQIGLASVPVGFETWIPRDRDFYTAVEGWVKERQVAALVVLTSFSDEGPKKKSKKSKGKHKRQLLAVVADNKDLVSTLFPGLEQNSQLQLEERSFKKFGAKKAAGDFGGELRAKVYKQGDVDATRKVVAPIIKEVVEGPPGVKL